MSVAFICSLFSCFRDRVACTTHNVILRRPSWCSPATHRRGSTAAATNTASAFCLYRLEGNTAPVSGNTATLLCSVVGLKSHSNQLSGAHCCQMSCRILAWTAMQANQEFRMSCHAVTQSRVSLQGRPVISRLDPALQKQWDHAANAHLGIVVITPYSHQKVGWICDQCPDGHLHSWSATVRSRANGSGCPQCSSRKVCKHNCLATKEASVAAQWDYAANDGTPDRVMAQSNQPAGWHCDACGHKWSATPASRVSKNRTGCPQCAREAHPKKKTKHPTFAGCNHPLLAEWDHERNAAEGHFPDNIRLKSNKHIYWLCNKCPAGQEHSWAAWPKGRTGRTESGCPCCAGHAACKCNSLQSLYSDIAAEWDHGNNKGQPSEHAAYSHHVARCSNPQCGSWQQSIASRTTLERQKSSRSKRDQQSLVSVSSL